MEDSAARKAAEERNRIMNSFEKLNGINVNEHVEQKNGLTYLSWAWAWAEVKKAFPGARYDVYENADGWIYHTDGKTCWVKTGVTIDGLEHIEYLPVMDFKNKSIPADQVTSFDVNKAVQRSLTKACARHGLGLYVYAGEDLPEDEASISEREAKIIKQLLEETDSDVKKFLKFFKASSVEELKASQYGKALSILSKKKEQMND